MWKVQKREPHIFCLVVGVFSYPVTSQVIIISVSSDRWKTQCYFVFVVVLCSNLRLWRSQIFVLRVFFCSSIWMYVGIHSAQASHTHTLCIRADVEILAAKLANTGTQHIHKAYSKKDERTIQKSVFFSSFRWSRRETKTVRSDWSCFRNYTCINGIDRFWRLAFLLSHEQLCLLLLVLVVLIAVTAILISKCFVLFLLEFKALHRCTLYTHKRFCF